MLNTAWRRQRAFHDSLVSVSRCLEITSLHIGSTSGRFYSQASPRGELKIHLNQILHTQCAGYMRTSTHTTQKHECFENILVFSTKFHKLKKTQFCYLFQSKYTKDILPHNSEVNFKLRIKVSSNIPAKSIKMHPE